VPAPPSFLRYFVLSKPDSPLASHSSSTRSSCT
jgi:hypothetical protein